MAGIDYALWWLTSAFSAILLAKLWRSGLLTQHTPFARLLAVGLARDAVLICFPPTHAYTLAWMITLPILLHAQAAAAVGCYGRIADLYPGIGRFAVRLYFCAK